MSKADSRHVSYQQLIFTLRQSGIISISKLVSRNKSKVADAVLSLVLGGDLELGSAHQNCKIFASMDTLGYLLDTLDIGNHNPS